MMMDSGSVWKKACALAFVMDFGGGLIGLAVPMLAVHLKAPPSLLGVIGAAVPLGYMLFCFLAQPLTDRWGRQKSMVIGSAAVTVLNAVLTFVAMKGIVWALGVLGFFVGASLAFFWPPTQATAGTGVPAHRLLTALLAYNLSWNSGRMLGTGLAGQLFEWHPSLPFLIATCASLCVTLLALRLRLPFPVLKASDSIGSANDPLALRLALSAQLGNFVRSFAFFETIVLFPALGKQWGWTEAEVSKLLSWMFVGQIAAFFAALLLLRSAGWRWVIGVKLSVGLITASVGVLTHRWALTVALLSLGVAMGLTTVVSLYLSITTQGQSVKGSARHEAGVGGGGVFGPMLGGFALEHASSQVAFLLPALLTAALLLCWDLPLLSQQAKGEWQTAK